MAKVITKEDLAAAHAKGLAAGTKLFAKAAAAKMKALPAPEGKVEAKTHKSTVAMALKEIKGIAGASA